MSFLFVAYLDHLSLAYKPYLSKLVEQRALTVCSYPHSMKTKKMGGEFFLSFINLGVTMYYFTALWIRISCTAHTHHQAYHSTFYTSKVKMIFMILPHGFWHLSATLNIEHYCTVLVIIMHKCQEKLTSTYLIVLGVTTLYECINNMADSWETCRRIYGQQIMNMTKMQVIHVQGSQHNDTNW